MCNVSRRLRALSVLATISVVMIHSHATLTSPGSAQWNVFLQYLVTGSFTGWAVPFFFLQSGYWFGRSSDSYFALLKKKFRSLATPYVLWAVVGGFALVPLVAVNNHLAGRPLFLRTFLEAGNVLGCLDSLFGVTVLGPRGDEPLWFVKNLVFLFLLAPAWRILRDKARWTLALIWLIEVFVYPKGLDVVMILPSAIGWFALGVFVSGFDMERAVISAPLVLSSGVLWTASSVVMALVASSVLEIPSFAARLTGGFIPLAGIIFLWGVSLRVSDEILRRFPLLAQMTFGVYCLHIIISGYWMAGWLKVLGKSDVSTLGCMLVTPFVVLVLSLGALVLLRIRLLPVYSKLMGQRT